METLTKPAEELDQQEEQNKEDPYTHISQRGCDIGLCGLRRPENRPKYWGPPKTEVCPECAWKFKQITGYDY